MGLSTRRQTYPAERLVAFSDAVVAVAITLLVLDLKLPDGLGAPELRQALAGLERPLWCYVLSFAVIGILWMAHHQHFSYVARVDQTVLWLNLVLLMTIALIPFVTSVMSDSSDPVATMLYAGVLMAACLFVALIWWHVNRHPELLSREVPENDRRAGLLTPLPVAGVFALSIGVAYWAGSTAAQWTWLLAAAAGPVADRLSRASKGARP
jgi:uncharacterized membrane protein